MPKKKQKNRKTVKVWEFYKINGKSLLLQKKTCPKCGQGVFLSQHGNRVSCGKCSYTVFEKQAKAV
ncbi:30S ribosomal protein S27ae [Candidatus Parvarchaeota archaeon]|nr:30S ribosomal protein S27ae [Candidatus Parvarchaeota archaeon]